MKFIKPTLPTTLIPRAGPARGLDPEKAAMHRQIRELTAEVSGLEEQIQAMRQSTSWRVSAPLRWLSRRLKKSGPDADPAAAAPGGSYADWVRSFDTAPPGRQDLKVGSAAFSIVLAAKGSLAGALKATVDSVHAQAHDRWDLVIVAEAGALGEFEADRTRLCESLEGALAAAKGDWILWLEPGDVLPAHALGHFASEIGSHEEARIIYADDDTLDAQGLRADPRFKPDWNLDLFYAQASLAHPAVIAKGLVAEAGGLGHGFDGEAAHYDLFLRCMERLRPGQVIRHIPRVLCHRSLVQPLASEGEAKALAQHFERTGTPAHVLQTETGRRVQYPLPLELPLVSLIIPTRNALALLRQCIESIVVLTTYANYEILVVDNGSDDPQALAYLAELNGQPGIAVIRDDRPFDYAALNNLAARRAQGEVLGLVNNDIEVITPGWLEEMVSLALQPGVGAVGARLLYPDESIQHGGVLLGVGTGTGVAGHAHKFLPATQAGYMNRAVLTQSFSAVTAACLVVRKALYEQLGGLDEVHLKIAYNDVDFCLRLREAGYRNVWTPYAELFHHESATRGSDMTPDKRQRFEGEEAYMRQRWGALIAADPAYNPNLSLFGEDFGLAWPPRVPWIGGAASS
jgi:O-antigen biosynthesis protein